MKRNYNKKLLDTVLRKTRNLHKTPPFIKGGMGDFSRRISIGADLIVGFPGETEADFLETLNGIETYNITKLHAFPFSDHHKGETVPASLYSHQVPQEIKKEREARLLVMGETIRNAFIADNA
ncbi:MAG: hypothetical protein LBU27_02800 [Candidatus Peribacteria bacterium]|jgi:tRNA A37 methylthiotransferase MiaB|nr:hypothetical protein [Candidatus Peribacteria bacterium]